MIATDTTVTNKEFEALAQKVDLAFKEIDTFSREDRLKALTLKNSIEEFHKYGLTKIIQRLKADPRGKELLFELVDDPAVYALFVMHDLIKIDMTTRVNRALELVRPYMQLHSGGVEALEVKEGTLYLKLLGACKGRSESATTLRNLVEETLKEHVPEIINIIEIPEEPAKGLIQVASLQKSKKSGWLKGPAFEEVSEGKPYCFEIGDSSFLLVKIGEQLGAFRNRCAHKGLSLERAVIDLEDGTLTCPWHGHRYDAFTGQCLTAPQEGLESVQIGIIEDYIWVMP
ncbi:NifU family protein [Candidatus Chlorohelix sp.]|uniref:NifU family protein n=1 Tax=Candidatus Chlorohelix sp. TaxID=3139201 RepID=UPI0030254E5B